MKYLVLVLLIALSTGAVAQTTKPAESPTPPSADSNGTIPYSETLPIPSVDIREFLAKNLVYPDSAKKNKIHGKVTINFAVNIDGTLGKFKARSHVGCGCEDEAIRVLSSMPPWTPGTQNGKPVEVFYTQVINFKL